MNNLKKIIGQMLILIIALNLIAPTAFAETEPEIACGSTKSLKTKYDTLKKEWDVLGANEKNRNAYDDAFKKARELHHGYIGCIFSFAENEILQSGGTVQGGEEAYSHNNDLLDWMAPDQACLTPIELKKIIQKTEPTQMLAPILEAHTNYKNYLNAIGKDFEGNGRVTNENGQALTGLEALVELNNSIGEVQRQRELEIISSLAAIDMAFTSLKELRLSIVMHVHFQCTLKFLEKYRTALEKLRNIIDALPDQLRDASISK